MAMSYAPRRRRRTGRRGFRRMTIVDKKRRADQRLNRFMVSGGGARYRMRG
jgi:hypothetical protein